MPEEYPAEVTQFLQRIQHCSQQETLKQTYDFILTRYRGYRILTYLRFYEAFFTSIQSIWARSGFLHCTSLNKLLTTFLLASGKFTKKDIRTEWMLLWFFSPHQFVWVRVGNTEIPVDLWGAAYKVPFGQAPSRWS